MVTEVTEPLELHCRCGVSFVSRVHASVRDGMIRSFWLVHSGPAHAGTTALEAEIERAHAGCLVRGSRPRSRPGRRQASGLEGIGMKQDATCRGCGAEILWVKTASGKRMPLDAESTVAGEYALEWEGNEATARKVGAGYAGERYTSHFVTCPNADEFRRRRPAR